MHFGFVEVAELLGRRGAKRDLRFAAGLGELDVVKSWFDADGSLKPGAGALADPYGQELKQHGQSPFRCERTRPNILSAVLRVRSQPARGGGFSPRARGRHQRHRSRPRHEGNRVAARCHRGRAFHPLADRDSDPLPARPRGRSGHSATRRSRQYHRQCSGTQTQPPCRWVQ